MELWTYRPEDFLLFSPRVYWRLFELHNAAWWPLPLATWAAGLAFLLVVLRGQAAASRWIPLALAVFWAFVAWSFLWGRFTAINWVIAYVVPAFGVQALMLAVDGLRRRGPVFEGKSPAARIGLLLAATCLVGYPLLPPLFGRPWTEAEIFGLAPDPTAIVTVGFVLAAQGGFARALLVIPLLWLLLSSLTLWTMGDGQAWLPFLAVTIAIAALPLRRRIAE